MNIKRERGVLRASHLRKLIGIIIMVALLCYPVQFLLHTSQSTHAIHAIQVFGRNAEIQNFTRALLNQTLKVIVVTGPPGIGKSSVVLNATKALQSKHDLCVVYIDCLEVDSEEYCESESSVLKYMVENQDGYILNLYPCITHLRNLLQYLKPFSKFTMHLWQQYLNANTVLILDNTDSVPKLLLKHPLVGGNLKIILVSRYSIRIPSEKSLQYHLKIPNLRKHDCIMFVMTTFSGLMNVSSARDLCIALDGIPLAVNLTANYLQNDDSTCNVTCILGLLKSSEYNQAFAAYERLVDTPFQELDENLSLVKALCVIFDKLKQEYQQCAVRLSEVRFGFTLEEVQSFYQDLESVTFPNECIETLHRYSLLQEQSRKYRFLPFIKKFIHWYKPVVFEGRNPKSFTKFWSNHFKYYVKILHQQLAQEDVFTAVTIGSNRQLVNSLLPLIDDFSMKNLFKSALKVIFKYCCSSLSIIFDCFSIDARFVYAYSRLTKAIHCPMMQADAVLLNSIKGNTKNDPRLSSCQRELLKCEKQLHHNWISLKLFTDTDSSLADDSDAMIDAHGYYNLLLMSTMKDSVPWILSLIDLSGFLTSIQRSFLLQHSQHMHSTAISVVNGLKYFALNDIKESEYYLTSAIADLHDDQGCQSVLRLIAIGALYKTCSHQSCEKIKEYLYDMALNNLTLECYLGVTNDIIIPFLNDSQKYFTISASVASLKQRFFAQLKEEKGKCQKEDVGTISRFDCFPLNRYRGIQARRLLRTRAKDIEKILNIYSSSGPAWLCSTIQDKTTKCNGEWPPLGAQYMSDYDELYHQYFGYLKWFMDDDEFLKWENEFHSHLDLNLYPYFE